MGTHELKMVAFAVWLTGTFGVMFLTATGRIRADHFNNVPFSKCLKSPQHQFFVVTILAWLMMFVLSFSQ